MRDNFTATVLSSIAHIEMGQSPDSSSIHEGDSAGVPFLQGNAEFGAVRPLARFSCTAPMKMCQAGDILLSVRAPVGALNIADRAYCIGRGLAAIRIAGMPPSLAAHLVSAATPALRRVAQGTTFEAINKSDLESLVVIAPPQGDRSQLTRVIDTLDTTIRQTEAIIEKLKKVRQGLLHDLLTRGIDANGELRPLQSQAPDLYKDSPLGWIPREWEASNVATEFDVTSGITLGPHRAPRSNPRKYLRVANVQRARLDLADVAELEASNAEMELRRLVPGDLLVVEGHASTEEIGRCAMAGESVRGFTFQNHLFRLRATRLNAMFSLHWMNSSKVRAYWRIEAATSSGLNTINRTKLDRVLVAVPCYAEQQRIVERVDAVDLHLAREGRYLSKLKGQKSGMMDDLLTGRVSVTPLLDSAGVPA